MRNLRHRRALSDCGGSEKLGRVLARPEAHDCNSSSCNACLTPRLFIDFLLALFASPASILWRCSTSSDFRVLRFLLSVHFIGQPQSHPTRPAQRSATQPWSTCYSTAF